MNMDLNGVIEKIRKEGVGKAEKDAADIVGSAQEKADKIIQDARDKEKEILAAAKKQEEELIAGGKATIRQASRDVLISLRKQIEQLFSSIIHREVSEQLTPDFLKEVILKTVSECVKKGQSDLQILLSKKERESLRNVLSGLLRKELEKEVTIKTSPSLKQGFRIGVKGKDEYYDFSDEAIAEALNLYFTRKIKEIVGAGEKDEG